MSELKEIKLNASIDFDGKINVNGFITLSNGMTLKAVSDQAVPLSGGFGYSASNGIKLNLQVGSNGHGVLKYEVNNGKNSYISEINSDRGLKLGA